MNEPNSYKRFDSIQPLPRRAVPSADEDLLSIIRRSASRMGYEDLRWILRPEGDRWDIKEKEIPLLSKKEDFHVLQHLLLLSEEQLHSHTLHRFAPLLEKVQDDLSHGSEDTGQLASKRKILLSPISKGNYFLPTDSIKVCPLCLREQESYDRLYWRMQLIEKCPACQAPISAYRHIPYRCPHCQQGDYRAAVSTLIRTDHPCYVGELLFLKMLGIMISECQEALPTLARSPLLTLSSRAYLHLLGAITSKLAWVFSLQELVLLTKLLEASPTEDLALQHVLYTTKRSVLFLLFNWLFLEWPMHFATFLDALYSISTPPYTGEKHENVSAYSRSLFNDSVDQDSYAWLHQAYQQYHQQFRFDPTRTDHLREKMNYLAQSMHKQQRETPELMQSKASDSIEKQEQMLYIPPRLLTPTLPYPWESITSVLSRAAEKMKHPFPELLLYRPPFTPNPFLIGSPNQPDSFGEPRLPFEVDDQILAYLLQIPLEDLSQLSRAQLVSSLGLRPYGISHQYAELNETDLNSWLLRTTFHITKICPSCVREQGGYDRLYWNLRGVLCCPRHRVQLLERCPTCLHSITSVRLQVSQCQFCQRDLCKHQTEPLPVDSLLLASTSVLMTMLRFPSSEASTAYERLDPSPLLLEEPFIYFALLTHFTDEIGSYDVHSQRQLLSQCFSHMFGDNAFITDQKDIDPYARDAIVLLFHAVFSNWPIHFFTFLTILYRSVRLYKLRPNDIQYRWWWLLNKKWTYITPEWLIDAFEKHELLYKESEDIEYH